jgi:hypothetical protein
MNDHESSATPPPHTMMTALVSIGLRLTAYGPDVTSLCVGTTGT